MKSGHEIKARRFLADAMQYSSARQYSCRYGFGSGNVGNISSSWTEPGLNKHFQNFHGYTVHNENDANDREDNYATPVCFHEAISLTNRRSFPSSLPETKSDCHPAAHTNILERPQSVPGFLAARKSALAHAPARVAVAESCPDPARLGSTNQLVLAPDSAAERASPCRNRGRSPTARPRRRPVSLSPARGSRRAVGEGARGRARAGP